MGLVRRGGLDGAGVSSGGEVADATFRADYPNLAEFLCTTRWPDGAARVPGTALAFVEAGRVKVCLSDKDQGLVCFVSAAEWLSAWVAAEDALGGDSGDWRPMKTPPQRQLPRK
jgi:hypothetical protein